MAIELILALYFSLFFPALWFVITPYIRDFRVMMSVAFLSVLGFTVGSWLLADLIPETTKLILSPISSPMASMNSIYNANISASKNIWAVVILLVPWIIIAIVVIKLAIGFILLSRKTRGFLPAESSIQNILNILSSKAGMKPPNLFIGEKKGFAFSTLNSVFISREIVDSLSEEKLTALLAHELAHIKRKDQISRWCNTVISSLSLFVPSKRVKEKYDLKIELETDKKATNILGDPIPLAQTLLFCAKKLTPQFAATNLTGIDSLTVRIKSLLSDTKPNIRKPLSKSVLAFSLVLVLTLTMVAPTLSKSFEVTSTPSINGLSEMQVRQLISGEMVVSLTRDNINPEVVYLNLISRSQIDTVTKKKQMHCMTHKKSHRCRTIRF